MTARDQISRSAAPGTPAKPGLGVCLIERRLTTVAMAVGAVPVDRVHRLFLQFDQPLPDPVLAAAADALRSHPDVVLRA